MTDEKALSIPNLIAALREAGFATKDDLKELRKQVKQDTADAIHEQLTNYHADMVTPDIE